MRKLSILVVLAIVCMCVSCKGSSNGDQGSPDYPIHESAEPTLEFTKQPTVEPTEPIQASSPDTVDELPREVRVELLQTLRECALVGCWMASPGYPSLNPERFMFFTNYDFIYLKSEYDGTNRVVSFSGRWKIISNTLELSIEEKEILIDGEEIFNTTLQRMMIEGGRIEKTMLSEPEVVIYSLSDVEIDSDVASYLELYREVLQPFNIQIGEVEYWKFDCFEGFEKIVSDRSVHISNRN